MSKENHAETTEYHPTTPQLTEDAVREIEARANAAQLEPYAPDEWWADIPALIRDWRAMRARIETLTTDWCECGHARYKHQFFSDHDECYECDQSSDDLRCEWRPAPRPNENAALREQLAAVVDERQQWLLVPGDGRSYFYRVHISCHEPLSEQERINVDGLLVEAIYAKGNVN